MKQFMTILKILAERYKQHNISAYSAQLAYFFTLSLFPFLIFLFAIIGRLSLVVEDFEVYLYTFVPQEPAQIITNYIRNLLGVENKGVLSISILFSLWTASRGFHALKQSLNVSYGVQETRNFVEMRVIGMIYTIMLTLAIVVALALPPMGMRFFEFLGRYVDLTFINIDLIQWSRWVFVIVFLSLIVSSIYYFMPNVKMRYREVLPGTAFAIASWMLISIGFSYFINNFGRFSIVYGSLAAMIIFMIWLYLTGTILMAGGEINYVLREYYKKINRNI